MNILDLSIKELSKYLSKKELSSVEITRAYLEAIEKDEQSVAPIHAYTQILSDYALEMAQKADEMIRQGKNTPLTGIPIALKDNLNLKGFPTTCSSKMLENYVATYNATVVEKLVNEECMVVIGKTNMDEFAMGSSTETSYFGITRNPHDKDRIPGGSSGGSAAAVAGKLAPAALGSDTGGSIRQPASLCGVVGLKPTYGLVSRYGLIAFASSLDQIGPITKNVEDAAILLTAISGHDSKDSTSLDIEPHQYTLNPNVNNLKIGIPKEFFIRGLDKEVEDNFKFVIKKLEQNGAKIEEISLPHSEYAVPSYYIVATAEASSNLERYDGIKYGYRANSKSLSELYKKTRSEGFGTEVKRRIMLGTYVLSAGYYDTYYLKALRVRSLIKSDFEKAFSKVDFVLGPTSPTPAFKIGEKMNDPIAMYLSDIYTISINLAGLPAISVPAGFSKDGLPFGIQIIGKLLDEQGILNLAFGIEKII